MELFKLYGSIFVDSEEAQKSISKTSEEANKFTEKLGEGIATAAKWGAALVAAGTAAVGSIVGIANKSASTADEIDKMSQKLGLSREAYQEWGYVLSQAGVDINSMEVGMKTLTNKIDDAVNGSASAQAMFNKLGLSMQDLQNMSREELFEATIKSFQGMEDSAQRAALANDLYGKSGQNLTPLFNSTAEATDKLIKKSHELGMVISDEAVDAGVSLTDTMDTLKRTFSAVGTNLGASLAPIVEEFCNLIIDYMPQINEMIQEIVPVLQDAFETIVPVLVELAGDLFPAIFDLLAQIMPVLSEAIAGILPVMAQLLQQITPILVTLINEILPIVIEVLSPILELLNPILATLAPLLAALNDIIKPILELVSVLLPPLAMIISEIIINGLNVIQPIIEKIASFMSVVLKAAIEVITEGIQICGEAFGIAWNFIEGVWSKAAGFFNGIWSIIYDTFSIVAEWFGSIFSDAYDSICKFFSPIGDFFKGVWDTIQEVFTNVGEVIGEAVEGTVAKAINTILDTACSIINGFISAINAAISIINKIPGVHLSKLDKLDAPELEEGGVLKKGQVGILEGNGTEAVVPLEKNKQWISRVADDMNVAINNQGGSISNKALEEILELIKAMISNLPDMLVDSLSKGVKFDVDKREFGRLVRQVNT